MLTIRCVFFFNDTATTEIYTLSLHDALPICRAHSQGAKGQARQRRRRVLRWPVEEDGLCEGDEGRHHGDREDPERLLRQHPHGQISGGRDSRAAVVPPGFWKRRNPPGRPPKRRCASATR